MTPINESNFVAQQVNNDNSGNCITEYPMGGIQLTQDNLAHNIPAVWSAIRIIAESVAQTPLITYKRNGTSRERANDYFLYPLLKDEPSLLATAPVFFETLMHSALLHGNGYAAILRDNKYKVQSLINLHPRQVSVYINNGAVEYHVVVNGQTFILESNDILHLVGLSTNGITGLSPLNIFKNTFKIAQASEDMVGKFYANGAHLGGVLSHPAALSEAARKNLKESVSKFHKGMNTAFGLLLVEEGLKFEPLTFDAEALQCLETRTFTIQEIARIFRVQPHLIGELSKSTNNNIEQQNLEFYQMTLQPWLTKLEKEVNRKLIPLQDKKRYYCEFNIDGLLRSDITTRTTFYKEMFGIGVMSQNEIRTKENLNEIGPEGDIYYIPVNNFAPAKVAAGLQAPQAPQLAQDQPAQQPQRSLEVAQTGSNEQQNDPVNLPQSTEIRAESTHEIAQIVQEVTPEAPQMDYQTFLPVVKEACKRLCTLEFNTISKKKLEGEKLIAWSNDWNQRHLTNAVEIFAGIEQSTGKEIRNELHEHIAAVISTINQYATNKDELNNNLQACLDMSDEWAASIINNMSDNQQDNNQENSTN